MPNSVPGAITFSNDYARKMADLLAREDNRGSALISRWNGLGGGAPATAVMAADLQAMALFMIDNQAAFVRAEIEWNEYGQTVISAGQGTLQDGAALGPDGRPIITTDKLIAIVTNWRARVNWLGSGSAVWPTTTPLLVDGANMATLVTAYHTPTAANCGNVINRLTELKTQYEANTNAVRGQILAVAVNPS